VKTGRFWIAKAGSEVDPGIEPGLVDSENSQ